MFKIGDKVRVVKIVEDNYGSKRVFECVCSQYKNTINKIGIIAGEESNPKLSWHIEFGDNNSSNWGSNEIELVNKYIICG